MLRFSGWRFRAEWVAVSFWVLQIWQVVSLPGCLNPACGSRLRDFLSAFDRNRRLTGNFPGCLRKHGERAFYRSLVAVTVSEFLAESIAR